MNITEAKLRKFIEDLVERESITLYEANYLNILITDVSNWRIFENGIE